MSGNEIRQRFLDFFAKRNHTVVPSAPLVPENDPTVLFTTAGMQPLVPYLMGQPHPTGSTRIVDSQKCLRTNDIDEVGDNTHLTFFEMLGNWSLGDYFKEDAIRWSFEFLTSKDEGLGLDPQRLYVTVFAGDENAPQDDEAHRIWSEIFTTHGMDPDKRIFFMDAEANWWSPGDNGPCGPDSEMFYDVTGTLTGGLTRAEFIAADGRQDVVEIWNDVFMEYEKANGKVTGKLTSQNVDTGSGLERVTAMVQGVNNVFETDLFTPLTTKIRSLTSVTDDRAVRIIADHIRAAVFLISDGVVPANTDQGYILRRLIRRSVRQADKLNITPQSLTQVAQVVIDNFGEAYPNLITNCEHIIRTIDEEEAQFRKTLIRGLKELEREFDTYEKEIGEQSIELWAEDKIQSAQELGKRLYPHIVFKMVTTYGVPIEMVEEMAHERGLVVDREQFEQDMADHQTKSRTGAEHKFKGGLADHSDTVVQYHTLTHLLLAALQDVLGKHVHQAGSNITAERLRFDFTHPEKLSPDALQKVENWVNNALSEGGTVSMETTSKSAAEADTTVEGSFWEKYPEQVTIYTITNSRGEIISRELCGGPHVRTLAEIPGTLKLKKEESVAAGIRRLKAVLAK